MPPAALRGIIAPEALSPHRGNPFPLSRNLTYYIGMQFLIFDDRPPSPPVTAIAKLFYCEDVGLCSNRRASHIGSLCSYFELILFSSM